MHKINPNYTIELLRFELHKKYIEKIQTFMIEKGLPVKTGQLQQTAEKFKRLMHHIENTYAIFEAHKKKAYLPISEEVKMQFSSNSKIGEIPYLRNENDWPVCPNCQRNMDLLVV